MLDKAQFAASFAADVAPEKAEFMANSQVPWGVVALNGTLTQIVAMLMDRGVPLGAATRDLAASGIAAIAGRIVSGWCVDRYHGPYVAIGFYVLPMIGTLLLMSPSVPVSSLSPRARPPPWM